MSRFSPARIDPDAARRALGLLAVPDAIVTEIFAEAAAEVVVVSRGRGPAEERIGARQGACLRVVRPDGGTRALCADLGADSVLAAAEALDLDLARPERGRVARLGGGAGGFSEAGAPGRQGTGPPGSGAEEVLEAARRLAARWRGRVEEAAAEALRCPGVRRAVVLFRGVVRWTCVYGLPVGEVAQAQSRGILGVSCFTRPAGPGAGAGRGELHTCELAGYSSPVAGTAGEADEPPEAEPLQAEPPWAGAVPALAAGVARRAVERRAAASPPAGEIPVIIAAGAGATLLHEACGHLLEADTAAREGSPFAGRLGQAVASPLVTVIDDPALPGAYGSFAADDEGTRARRSVLIEAGRLAGFLGDLASARRVPGALPGHARRASFDRLPSPRMSNTFIVPGTAALDDMAAAAGCGLLVRRLGSGRIDPRRGRFWLEIAEGDIIRNGRAAGAVTGGILTGTGPELLVRVRAVGRDLELGPGRCRKDGSEAEVTGGGPSLWIEKLEVLAS